MGEKNKKKTKMWDWECPYCRKRFVIAELDDKGYVDHIGNEGILRDVVWCPSCDGQELIEKY